MLADTKAQFKNTVLDFWTKFVQKGISRPTNSNYSTIMGKIFEKNSSFHMK